MPECMNCCLSSLVSARASCATASAAERMALTVAGCTRVSSTTLAWQILVKRAIEPGMA